MRYTHNTSSLAIALAIALATAGCNRASDDTATAPADTAPAAETPAPEATTEPAAPPAPVTSPVESSATEASATLAATQGNQAAGQLTLNVEDGGAVRVTGTLHGLEAGSVHGIHIHETGDCSAPDASSAGAHFNPGGAPHGDPAGPAHHAGDMPNITADAQGDAMVDLRVSGLELGSGGANDAIGKALVVHEKADDYQTQPSGDSGSRIACGVIEANTAAAP